MCPMEMEHEANVNFFTMFKLRNGLTNQRFWPQLLKKGLMKVIYLKFSVQFIWFLCNAMECLSTKVEGEEEKTHFFTVFFSGGER